jgi:SPX domain protein involved in polyphosphate accumulation
MFKTNYRYERKFYLSQLNYQQLQLILKLHPANFTEIYQERQINNVYLDTYQFEHYHNNIAEAKDRLKIRVRWYDNSQECNNPQLEFKIKSGLLNKKIVYPIKKFSISPINIKFQFPNNQIDDQLLINSKNLQAVLLNTYQRQYFQDFTKQFRITIDRELNFYPISSTKKVNWHKKLNIPATILELKYATKAESDADKITNFFPFRLSRSSKYIIGIDRLYPKLRIC